MRPNRIAEGIPVSHSITILYVQRKGSSGDFLKSWLITLIGRIDFVITGFMSGAIYFLEFGQRSRSMDTRHCGSAMSADLHYIKKVSLK